MAFSFSLVRSIPWKLVRMSVPLTSSATNLILRWAWRREEEEGRGREEDEGGFISGV